MLVVSAYSSAGPRQAVIGAGRQEAAPPAEAELQIPAPPARAFLNA